MDVQESNFYYSSIKECLKFKDEVDICDLYKYRIGGIGYNELRYCSIDKDGELAFESNNVHDYKRGDTCYKIFRWKELTDYEMYTLYEVLCKGQRYNDKTDTISLGNSMNYARRDEGFSIKLQLGSASTLLKAGEPTNILYRIEGNKLTDEDIVHINSIKKHLPRMQAIIDSKCKLVFSDIENKTFKNNLLFLDYCMPQFIAECLIVGSLPNATSTVKDTVSAVASINPFNYTGFNILSFYEHKMKNLLLDVALGMTPATEWEGHYDANGGYLVVKQDGEIVCYHFYNRNDVEDYLFSNTRFERASRKRYHFGELFRGNDGNVYIRLNLQIRFIK